jgi:hypothetical protein
VNSGDAVDVIYADMSKAFDKVPHQRLLKKIEVSFGIRGELLLWLSSFLSDRMQVVNVSGTLSRSIAVTSGVPQGSVVGPLLFAMYVDDLDTLMSGYCLKWADDTKIAHRIHRSHPSLAVEDLTLDLESLEEWATTWGMTFNGNKSACLHFGHWNPEHVYRLGGADVPNVQVQRDLGVLISSTLKQEDHCLSKVKKAEQLLGVIRRSFIELDKETFLPLYFALVRPCLEYAVCAWSPHYQRDVDLVERVQKRAVKMVKGMRRLNTYEDRLRALGLQTLATRRLRADMIFTYRLLHGHLQVPVETLFKYCASDSLRGHCLKIRPVVNPRLDVSKYAYAYRVVSFWNGLPEDCVTAPTVQVFKSRMHQSGLLPNL